HNSDGRPQAWSFGGLDVAPLGGEPRGTAKFDLTVDCFEGATGAGDLAVSFDYNADLFDAGTMVRLGRQLLTLLASAVAAPDVSFGRLALLEPEERHRILVEWNDTAAPLSPDVTLHGLVEAQ